MRRKRGSKRQSAAQTVRVIRRATHVIIRTRRRTALSSKTSRERLDAVRIIACTTGPVTFGKNVNRLKSGTRLKFFARYAVTKQSPTD